MMRTTGLGLVVGMAAGTAAWADLSGTYDVAGTNPAGAAYAGTAEIAQTPEACVIVWATAEGTSEGVCMVDGDRLAAAYVIGDALGLLIYTVGEDGTLSGTWSMAGQAAAGTEILTPQQ